MTMNLPEPNSFSSATRRSFQNFAPLHYPPALSVSRISPPCRRCETTAAHQGGVWPDLRSARFLCLYPRNRVPRALRPPRPAIDSVRESRSSVPWTDTRRIHRASSGAYPPPAAATTTRSRVRCRESCPRTWNPDKGDAHTSCVDSRSVHCRTLAVYGRTDAYVRIADGMLRQTWRIQRQTLSHRA